MKNNKRLMLVLVLITTSLILSQCKLPERRSDDYFASVVPPLQGAVFGVGENVEIHGGVFDWLEIDTTRESHLFYYANGIQIGEEYQTIMPGYYVTTERNPPIWIPEEPGEYFLQVSSFRRPHWAISQAVRVCVLDFSITTTELGDIDVDYGTYGYEGECELPERSPDAVPGPITFDVTASPDPISYFPGWWDDLSSSYYSTTSEIPLPAGCEDLPSEITFRAAVGDPYDEVVMVKVDITYEWISSIYRFLSLLLTRESGSGLDPKIFSGEGWMENYGNPSEINKSFEVDWTAYAYNRSGDIVATDGPHTIPVNPCYNAETARDITIPSEPPAFTLPDVSCPEGTFYVPILRQCVPTTSFDTEGFRGIDLNGPGNSDEGDQGENSCNLSSEICGNQGYSFDSNNCQCIPLP